jgi:glutamyl-tRNA synthetase
VTRFPPEPSGYLHIGHIKAAMLNAFYATMYKGKLILRFDDTNPAKEKDDYVDNIKEDLAEMGIQFQAVSYTSDYFDQLEKYAEQLLKLGRAFIDDTPLEQMRAERRADGNEGVESRCRNQTIEENLRLFSEMKAGSPEGLKCVMRAKIGILKQTNTPIHAKQKIKSREKPRKTKRNELNRELTPQRYEEQKWCHARPFVVPLQWRAALSHGQQVQGISPI